MNASLPGAPSFYEGGLVAPKQNEGGLVAPKLQRRRMINRLLIFQTYFAGHQTEYFQISAECQL
jgi:hypothetical protein